MGAKRRQRDEEMELLSQTEKLFKWISQMRTKKIKYLRNRQRNIRIEAVLGHALSQAEQQLRNKQIARIDRWQELKKQKAMETKNNNNNNNSNNNGSACKFEEVDQSGKENCNNNGNNNNKSVWDGNLPELNSLDMFMSQLSEIKSPLQR